MESGFGKNLEGFLIKGNLSLISAELPDYGGNGSIEGSGTLYIDSIRQYNANDNGLNIENVIFRNKTIIVPYTQPSSDPTSASFIIDGGISIKATQDATSSTSGGGLTVLGGVGIGKNLYVNQSINVGSTGSIVINNTSTTTNIASYSTGLVCKGGANIYQNLNVGGLVNVTGNRITGVATPIIGSDAVNLDYLNDRLGDFTFTGGSGTVTGNFTSGQIIIADTNGNSIRGFESLRYETSGLIDSVVLSDTTVLNIKTTIGATGLGSGGSLTVAGGASILGNVYIGSQVDVTGHRITGVDTPIVGSDAVNLDYLTDVLINMGFTSGTGITGDFKAGQLLVGLSDEGNVITGYDNVTFAPSANSGGTLLLDPNTSLVINNTTNATGVGTGGALTVDGGASFGGTVYIGDGLDVNLQNITNVKWPINPLDGVNKDYVDDLYAETDNALRQLMACCCEKETAAIYLLDNNVLVPQDISPFSFDPTVRAFLSYVYVNYDDKNCAIFTLRGINRGNDLWWLSSTYVGDATGVNFFIRGEMSTSRGVIQYTNSNSTGLTSIRFRNVIEIDNVSDVGQINLTLTTTEEFVTIPGFVFDNTVVDSAQVIVSIANDSDGHHAIYFINCVLMGDSWISNIHSLGNLSGIQFRLLSDNVTNTGILQYRNTNSGNGDYILRAKQTQILKSQNEITLLANTTVNPLDVNSAIFSFDESVTDFQLKFYVTVTGINKYALFEVEGVKSAGTWLINTRFIGDQTGINFYIRTTNNIGYLQYTNTNNYDAILKYIKDVPLLFEPMSVSKGGTGNRQLQPYTVLRGNGYDPIIGTVDFIYQDYKLILGEQSSIVLKNTSPAINFSTGTLVTDGGISVQKNVIIGDSLTIKNIDVTPSIGDISAERSFSAQNNQQTPVNVTGWEFTEPRIKSFSGIACVTILIDDPVNDQLDALYEVKGLRKKSGWMIQSTSMGDTTGVVFNITGNGQVQYTSTNITNWISTTIKFRAMTTTLNA